MAFPTSKQRPYTVSNFIITASSYELAIEAGHLAAQKVKENNSASGIVMIRGERITWQIRE